VYIKPLRVMQANDRSILTSDEIKLIFGQIEVILLYNKQFLEQLEAKIGKKWNYSQTVGDIFITFAEFFRGPYKHFIMKFSEITGCVTSSSQRSGVLDFFKVNFLPARF
jgi:hypothetical protein